MPTGEHNYRKRIARQTVFLDQLAETGDIKGSCVVAGISYSTYRKWRQLYPDFCHRADEIKQNYGIHNGIAGGITSADHWASKSFADFRLQWFHTKTPAFQREIIHAYEHTELGHISMILIPPEHGKTTLFEDYAAWKLATNPKFRMTVGSEAQNMSRKILNRVKNRLDPEGPFPDFVEMFGPFIPQTKSKANSKGGGHKGLATRQPWGADFFSVFKKKDFDERDYSMVGLGITSQIAGTRTDHLHIDDAQSLNNITQTVKIVEVIRQDWFSRVGQRGRSTINGTRVGPEDMYETLEDELPEDVLSVIRMPAIRINPLTGEDEPLWPWDDETEWGWTMEMLDRQRKTVGPVAWARNYMQKPSAAGEQHFTDEIIEPSLNPLRSIFHKPPDRHGPLMIGLDPSIEGANCFSVVQAGERFRLIHIREDYGLKSNQHIMGVMEELILRYAGPNNEATLTDVVIEEKAFQRGLLEDESLQDLKRIYGFAVRGHDTGRNKNDENIGVAGMVHNFVRGEIDLPWADDDPTRRMTGEFVTELKNWRPYKRGTRLKQDRVMAFWFPWLVWRSRRRSGSIRRTGPIRGSGLGYDPTQGLILGDGDEYAA